MKGFINIVTIPSPTINTIFYVTIEVVLIVLFWHSLSKKFPTLSDQLLHHNDATFPFIIVGEASWKDLHQSLEQYNRAISITLTDLSQSLEVAQLSEFELFGKKIPSFSMAKKISTHIDLLSKIAEQDGEVLQALIQPFPVVNVLMDQSHNHYEEDAKKCNGAPGKEEDHEGDDEFSHLPPPRFSSTVTNVSESAAYDSAQQVVAHLVRDWTVIGKKLRRSTYHWCREKLQVWVSSRNYPVLVPGAGLCRLAHDLYKSGYSVEANDASLVMASAARAILSNALSGELHPFAFDFFVNQVNSEQRYETVHFPDWQQDDDLQQKRRRSTQQLGSLSYTVGDFVELYSAPYAQRQYGAIVTCFFIDTATNIYEYLSIIYNLLREGGIWINVGPLQWHSNAKIRPSVDEMRLLVGGMGFDVKEWTIDTTPIPYRHDEVRGEVNSTKYEGYRPLRFVAVRKKNGPAIQLRPKHTRMCQESNVASGAGVASKGRPEPDYQ